MCASITNFCKRMRLKIKRSIVHSPEWRFLNCQSLRNDLPNICLSILQLSREFWNSFVDNVISVDDLWENFLLQIGYIWGVIVLGLDKLHLSFLWSISLLELPIPWVLFFINLLSFVYSLKQIINFFLFFGNLVIKFLQEFLILNYLFSIIFESLWQ